MTRNAAVIGAGVSGLTCGVLLAEAGFRSAIFADEIGQRTTSAAAAAVWYPYDAEPAAAVIAWSLTTFERLRALAADPASGVSMIALRQFARISNPPIPEWALPLGAVPVSAAETPPGFTTGFVIKVPLTDTTIYLDYLTKRFTSAGGEIRERRLERLEDAPPDCDVIINCAGLGARTLVPDPEMESHRGQVALVAKLAIDCAIVSDDAPLMYAIPRANDCVFGGTNEISDSREPDPAQTTAIVSECARVLGIAPPPVLAERVGLRPFRKTGVRVEAEHWADGRTVIHNYGHGGSGFTLSWGCALKVLDLAR
ncbi:MAG: FAD-dependent oxidoreductase [Chthoniobacterales bacterium]